MQITVNENVRKLMRERRIFSAHPDNVWDLEEILYFGDQVSLEPYCHILQGGVLPKAMGAFSYTFSRCDIDMEIGRYTSIARGVGAMGSAHPDDWASSHPFSHNPAPLRGIRSYLKDIDAKSFPVWDFERGDQTIRIGHDVWIGAEAMLKRNITIGHGAIIGTRSLVTKDVPPYAIVGGAPARIIRYRFDEALIERLLASEWWRYGPDVVQALDVRRPATFLDRLADKVAHGEIQPLSFDPLTAPQILKAAETSSDIA